MAKGEDITTKFKVDISDLKKGITEANNQIKLANSEFKKASAGMDNWAKSSDGIKAKLIQLKSVLEAQNSKLEAYQKQLQTAQKYQREASANVENLRKALEKAKSAYGENSTEVKKLEKQLSSAERTEDSLKKQVSDLTVAMNNQEATVRGTEKQMSNFEDSLTKVEKAEKIAARTGKSVDDVLKDMDESSKHAGDGFTILKGALANLVADGFKKAIQATKEFATSMIDTAAQVKAETSQFEQTFGSMSGEAETAIKRVADSTGILETRLKTTGAQIYAFARSNGATVPEAMSLMETALQASADSAAYYDKSLEESSETMMSFLKGNYANDAALGVSATEFTRNAKATELFGKKYNDLTEIQKQQTLLKMVTDSQELSGAMGQAAREADGWENVQGNLNETWRQFKASVGTPFLEALIPVIQDVTKSFTEWRNGVDWDAFGEQVKGVAIKIKEGFGWIIDNKDTIIAGLAGIVATFAATKIITFVTAMATAISAIKKAAVVQGILNAVMKANPIGLIAAAIGLLVAGIVLLIQNWDKVKETAVNCWEAIKSAWNVASDWFNTNIIDPIKNFFSEMWKDITGFFTDAWEGIKTVWTNVAEWFDTNVAEPIKKFFQPLVDWFAKLWNSISATIKSVFEVIKALAKGTVESIKLIWGIISSWFNEHIIEPVKKFFTDMWNGIKDSASKAWEGVKSVWNVVSNWFNDTIIKPVGNFFTTMWNNLKSGASKAWEGIKSVFTPVVNWFKDKFTSAWTAVKNVFSTGGKIFDGIKEGIASTFKTVVNGIIRGINKVISVPFDAINKVLNKIKNISIAGAKPFNGLPTISVPQIPTLATGIAKAKKGHQYLLEGKNDEAVIPLHKNAPWLKALACSLLNQLETANTSRLASNVNNTKSNVNNFTQIINVPKQLSRIELYRQTRNLLELKGGI